MTFRSPKWRRGEGDPRQYMLWIPYVEVTESFRHPGRRSARRAYAASTKRFTVLRKRSAIRTDTKRLATRISRGVVRLSCACVAEDRRLSSLNLRSSSAVIRPRATEGIRKGRGFLVRWAAAGRCQHFLLQASLRAGSVRHSFPDRIEHARVIARTKSIVHGVLHRLEHSLIERERYTSGRHGPSS